MMRRRRLNTAIVTLLVLVTTVSGCAQWRGANSLPLPGTEGRGEKSFTIRADLPDVDNIERNSRVRVGDVTVGNVEKIELQDWHAVLTMRINGDVELPANVTATIGQTSLLGSLHVELAPPVAEAPTGRLHEGSVIPLSSGRTYPSTEQALSAISLLLNNGGIGQLQEITQSLSAAFAGREEDLKHLLQQLDLFSSSINGQTDDIIAATDSLNGLVEQLAVKRSVVDEALRVVPDALDLLNQQRSNATEALTQLARLADLAADSADQTKESLVRELSDIGPVLQSLADAGPALTRSLSLFGTYPWPKENITKWLRGDYANLTAVIDMTLSRLDASMFTGTRFEGKLTELELQWGRTIGQMPSPYTVGNPLVVPYRWDQGP